MKAVNKWLLLLACIPVLLAPGCGGSEKDDGGGGGGTTPPPTVTEPAKIDQVVIYEAYPGMFGTSNTLAALTARLDDIKALGVNVLWVMPIFEQGQLKAFGSPYCVKDYKAVNPNYGTLADVKTLVSTAHGKGMRVIFDWIANHTSWDNAWITAHPDWYATDANGNIISPPGFNWTDVAQLNFDNADLRAAMIDAMKYWVTEADIDGYRCDYADGVPTDFWSAAIAELKALKGDDLLMLAESASTNFTAAGFDMIYAWDFAYRLQDVYAGSRTVSTLYSTNTAELQGLGEGKQRMRHITNHDINAEHSTTSLFKSESGAMSAFVIAATMGGCPMIYSSQEIGYAGRPSFYTNYTMDWSANASYRTEYQKLMSVRASSYALQGGGDIVTYNVDDQVACYKRSWGDEDVLVTVNTSAGAKTISLSAEFALSRVEDMMTGTSLTTTTTLSLEGYGYEIWKAAE